LMGREIYLPFRCIGILLTSSTSVYGQNDGDGSSRKAWPAESMNREKFCGKPRFRWRRRCNVVTWCIYGPGVGIA